MSDVFYPLSLIERLRASKLDRVIADTFDDGSTAARNTWSAQNFKRRFDLLHSPLTEAEWNYLRSFHSQRTGRYDSFWFRDNVNRDGNAKVRFASELQSIFQGRARRIQLMLEEVAPIRALPELDEVTTAAGTAPMLWYDANREIYYKHAGTAYMPESAYTYDMAQAYRATWQNGTTLPLANALAQYQYFDFANSQYAKASALTGLSSQAVTLFCFTKAGTKSATETLMEISSGGLFFRLQIYSSNEFQSAFGIYALVGTANSPNNTWRSLAVTASGSGTLYKIFQNAVETNSVTQAGVTSFSSPIFTIGAEADGSNKHTGQMNHVLVFPAALTLAQVKAVHNLLCYQFGLAQVA